MISQLPIKLNLSDIYMTYLQRFDPPKFDAKHALMFFDCDALKRSVKRFFFRLPTVVLEINFFQ